MLFKNKRNKEFFRSFRIPWWIILLSKLIISGSPKLRFYFEKRGFFSSGAMESAAYAFKTFKFHIDKALKNGFQIQKSVILEIGPGDSLISGLLGFNCGVGGTILVDSQKLSSTDVELYSRQSLALKKYLNEDKDLEIIRDVNFSDVDSFDEFLKYTNTKYLTDGLQSFKALDSNSCDLIWSQSVLQHFFLDEVADLIKEQKRVLKPSGIVSHAIDFKDTISESLNNLRFSEKNWENKKIKSAGFYTNRLRLNDWIRLYESEGFKIIDIEIRKWDNLPVPINKLHKEISGKYTEDQLKVSGVKLVLKL